MEKEGVQVGSRPAWITYKYPVLKRKNKFTSLPSGARDPLFVSPVAFF